ncbi:MAG: Na+/H+ antiporter NhaC family protein [Alphaproteobacteria bacterium]
MEPTFGILSIVPPLVAIGLALWTRQVFLALAVGIWMGYIILAGWHPLEGTIGAVEAQIGVLTNTDNARFVVFTLIMGALIALIQRSGGVEGFIGRILVGLEKIGNNQAGKGNRKVVETLSALTGIVLFIETNISILTVGTLYRPIFDRLKIPREKLGYIADSTCAPMCVLVPFNAWGAFIMGLLLAQGVSEPFTVLAGSILYNFYPILTIVLIFVVIWTGWDWGDMKTAETRARETGKVLRDGAVPMMDDSISMMEVKDGLPLRAVNMIVPVLSMVVLMFVFLIYTGWAEANGEGLTKAWDAMKTGSGSAAVLYAVSGAIIIAMLMYKSQKLFGIREMIELCLTGMSGMVGITLLTVLSFALNDMCRDLGTGQYMADLASGFITPAIVPALIFILASFIAFSTGTSWGAFAIMIAVAVPLSESMGVNMSLAVAAAIGGGIFGDHCSPTSDTTIITSMATANDHIDHVRTQIPYAIIAGLLSIVLYLILGFAAI